MNYLVTISSPTPPGLVVAALSGLDTQVFRFYSIVSFKHCYLNLKIRLKHSIYVLLSGRAGGFQPSGRRCLKALYGGGSGLCPFAKLYLCEMRHIPFIIH